MGKRSNFERRNRDDYPTPAKAVTPLVPWLAGIRTFAEPCAGDGDLIRYLESHGLCCTYRGDIATGHDALELDSYGNIDAIITNPPWKRLHLHPLVQHFARIAPTWLLLDQDWAGTKQATSYLKHCTDILPIGRFIWIPGTRWPGKDNAAWYHFDARHTAGPVLHPYRSAPAQTVLPQQSDSKTCSGAQAAQMELPL